MIWDKIELLSTWCKVSLLLQKLHFALVCLFINAFRTPLVDEGKAMFIPLHAAIQHLSVTPISPWLIKVVRYSKGQKMSNFTFDARSQQWLVLLPQKFR